jgi:branched-chain amino acid transport system substrate-binding protein
MGNFCRNGLLSVVLSLASLANVYAENTLKIGGLFDLSGGGKVWGTTEKNAATLAIAEFNASKNSCAKASLTVKDTTYDAKTTVAAFNKLTKQDKIHFIVGPTWEVCEVTIPRCEANKVLCLEPSCHAGIFSRGTKQYSFSLWFNDAGYGEILGSYLADKPYKNIVAISSIGAYYDAVTDGFLMKVQHPVQSFRVLPQAQDFKSIIGKMPKETDAVFILLNSNGQIQSFVRQWKEARGERPLLLSDDEFDASITRDNIDVHDFPRAISTPRFDLRASHQFVKSYKKKFGEEPRSPSGATAYDATKLILDCACESDQFTDDVDVIQACITRERQRVGVSGRIAFDAGHQIVGRDFEVKLTEAKDNGKK